MVNARRRCWVNPLQVNSKASPDANANAERKCDWGLAGISVVKREHEGRGAAGWVILFDPVRGLDESTRQRLCSSARLPRCCSSLFLSLCVCPSPCPVSSVYACAPCLDYCSLIVDFQGNPRIGLARAPETLVTISGSMPRTVCVHVRCRSRLLAASLPSLADMHLAKQACSITIITSR